MYTSIFLGKAAETAHPARNFSAGVEYFVQLDRDEADAVITIRTGSFDGPIYVVNDQSGLTSGQNVGEYFWLSTESGLQTTAFEDVRVDSYEVP